jgi:hypothetical protein
MSKKKRYSLLVYLTTLSAARRLECNIQMDLKETGAKGAE